MSLFRQTFEFKRLDHAFFRDLMENTVKAVFIPVVILVDISVPSATVRLEGFEDHLISMRSQPLDIEIRVHMRPVDKLTRSVELAGDEQFLFARLNKDRGLIFFGHFVSPFSEVPVKRHRGGQSARSKIAQKA